MQKMISKSGIYQIGCGSLQSHIIMGQNRVSFKQHLTDFRLGKSEKPSIAQHILDGASKLPCRFNNRNPGTAWGRIIFISIQSNWHLYKDSEFFLCIWAANTGKWTRTTNTYKSFYAKFNTLSGIFLYFWRL